MTDARLSVQLYSVRDALAADLDGTLARLSSFGLTTVEVIDLVSRADELAPALERHGMRAASGHAPLLSPDTTASSLDEAFAAANTLGLEVVVDPYVSSTRWLDEESVIQTATLLNVAAVRAAEHGLRVAYHNHSQEFHASFDGRTAFELFVENLDDAVELEVDLFWAQTAGQDAPALLRRVGARASLLHMKDGIIGADPFRPDAGPPELDQRPAGQGEVPLLECLAAAPAAQYAIIEFDTYEGDVFEAIRQSAEYLVANGVAR